MKHSCASSCVRGGGRVQEKTGRKKKEKKNRFGKRSERSSSDSIFSFSTFAVEKKKLAIRGIVSSSATLKIRSLSREHDENNTTFVTRPRHQTLGGGPGGKRGRGSCSGGIKRLEEEINDACRRLSPSAAAFAAAAASQ